MTTQVTPLSLAQSQAAAVPVNWFGSGSNTLKDVTGKPLEFPALVYTAWSGKSCGDVHKLEDIGKAAKALGIPLYAINSLSDGETQIVLEGKPGAFVDAKTPAAAINALAQFDLQTQSGFVVLAGKDGKPMSEILSARGETKMVERFKPLLDKARSSELQLPQQQPKGRTLG